MMVTWIDNYSSRKRTLTARQGSCANWRVKAGTSEGGPRQNVFPIPVYEAQRPSTSPAILCSDLKL